MFGFLGFSIPAFESFLSSLLSIRSPVVISVHKIFINKFIKKGFKQNGSSIESGLSACGDAERQADNFAVDAIV
jgi:hypothetical protein